ncbi:MAG: hypothetical protein E7388_03790 [Ruminococcaceae bacterium]|nr:hypothetical protein [Oscillospiraceae bacterium]
MSKLLRTVYKNGKTLSKSSKTLEDLYKIICSHGDSVMAEYSTMTKKFTYSYKQAEADIGKIAVSISKETGETGKFIGLHGDNSYQWIVMFWGILKSGNKPYLINLRQPVDFTTRILKTLDVSHVVTLNDCPDYGINILYYDDLIKKSDSVSREINVAFGNEFALATSGTTLKEKICVYNGEKICNQLLNFPNIVRANKRISREGNSGMKLLAFLPMYHIFGLEAMYLWFSFAGATFVFLSDLAPANILRTCRYHEVTHVFAVPLLWHSVEKGFLRELETKDEKTKQKFKKVSALSLKIQNVFPNLGKAFAGKIFKDVQNKLLGTNIKFCISGGSAVKTSSLKLLNSIGYHLCNGYGMSEIGITSVELSGKPKELIKGSIGKPFDSVCYKIGEQQQLLVKGDSLCSNVIIDGEMQSMPEWFPTGDIMHTDEKGAYYIDGRVSDVVFGDDGENLNPDYAEQAFELKDATALSVLGNSDNTRLMLVVRISKGLMQIQKDRLKDEIRLCNEKLPPSYRVGIVKFTYDPLMSEQAIKVSRAYLRRAIEEGKVSLFDMDLLDQPVEEGEDSEIKCILRELFAKTLNVPVEQITDNGHFMLDLNGSSLDYFTLVGFIQERFNVRIDFETGQFGYSVNDFEKIIKELI